MPIGRPKKPLPLGLSPAQHEAKRIKLGLSKREYAAKIHVPQATYCKETRGVAPDPDRSPPKNPVDPTRRHQLDRKEILKLVHAFDDEITARGVDLCDFDTFLRLLGELHFCCPIHADANSESARHFDWRGPVLRGCLQCARELRGPRKPKSAKVRVAVEATTEETVESPATTEPAEEPEPSAVPPWQRTGLT